MADVAPPPCGKNVLKLCINSHVAYRVPLHKLLVSLLAARFEHFDDVLLMLGGSATSQEPEMVQLEELVPGLDKQHGLVVTRTQANGFDYHGLALLYQHRHHPLVSADVYIYLHDTTTVDPDTFIERFESFRLPRREAGPLLFSTWPLPNSNIVAFGAAVVHRYGRNFEGNLSKAAAFPMEFGYPFERPGASAVLPLISFGYVIKVGPRIPRGSSDVYGTGVPRNRFYYPAFGIYKYSMRSDAVGDIVAGKLTPLFNGKKYYPPNNASKLARVNFGNRPRCWEVGCREVSLNLGGHNPLRLPACVPMLWGNRSSTKNATRAHDMLDG